MKFNKWTLALAAVALTALTLAGCQSKLENGGAYAPGITQTVTNADSTVVTNFTPTAASDQAFYYADATYALAYAVVDGVLKAELQNGDALFKLNPKIKHTLDPLRPKLWAIHQRWALARKAYLSNPIPANLTAFQTVVAELQALLPAVNAVATDLAAPAKR